ncbi:hypothetical protein PAXRUDRAFT_141363 [Paxillus rubicundulus Ve08.2h10]|uniref:Uncharacterized protein n=1 Tax=Paxillus rubicundulus Ve08.2h10 TaxID=930991 RepID=A0A0D0DY64_9AGAM|nr:hypothetical protein PAXRUDRAFT_141363 [Paxillus rubicundulus Ve08.2h10]
MPHPPLAPKTHNNNIPSEFPSPGVTTKHAITLDQSCAKYNISASDSEKLAVLEYVPVNCIVELLTDTDYEKVGFGVLGWRTFLSHHCKFCSSIVAGTWPE